MSKVLQVSKACHSLCLWIHAMYNYYFVNKKVEPKMVALAKADEILFKTERELAAAMEKLREIEEGIEKLQNQLKEKEAKRVDLENQKQLCEKRMGNAVRLIVGLSDEQKRWIIMVGDIKVSLTNAVGDILLSAGASKHFSIITLVKLFIFVYEEKKEELLITYIFSKIIFLYKYVVLLVEMNRII